jgi:DivIVA domain-containing protein
VDRAEIERHDFPVGRRGYEQAAVDEHLRRVADEFERLRAAPGRTSLAAGASEQVRAILEASERSAAELRDDAGREASEHVARVGAAADGMLDRLEQLETELGTLLEALRRSGERLTEGLAELQADVAGVAGADPPRPPAADPGEPPVAEEDFAAAAPVAEDQADDEPHEHDEEAARLIALNMALGGSSREETAAYLQEHFTLADAGALLDDVYAKVDR